MSFGAHYCTSVAFAITAGDARNNTSSNVSTNPSTGPKSGPNPSPSSRGGSETSPGSGSLLIGDKRVRDKGLSQHKEKGKGSEQRTKNHNATNPIPQNHSDDREALDTTTTTTTRSIKTTQKSDDMHAEGLGLGYVLLVPQRRVKVLPHPLTPLNTPRTSTSTSHTLQPSSCHFHSFPSTHTSPFIFNNF